ncbi:polysaccharide pyruvyl transferase family protein [Clostridium sp.]|uniref:polysaccharide pyruvyl transferase family protein n=1 Tax=Clostridium sp. TaxID=1506 RepID=UPI0006A7E2EB|nr:polysaccharide pyruvyl transferase family protein [Clostridium sp.]MDU1232063.1 polysaccharide pyruvyl transferase family protein [Clostridium sp.]MDU3090922.1 polysaccharide pyruvyl transferase family protein [Clostridium sp.]
MKRVGIITLNGYFNYGNRLQNYALQHAIEMLNFECETILNDTYILKQNNKNNSKVDKIKYFLKKDFLSQLITINEKINKKRIQKINQNRTEIFKEFSKKYLNETQFSISINNIRKNLENKYEYFVSGSDQVWNPNDPMVSEINFMTFAPKSKRLTYAPSFGVSSIPEKYKKDYSKWLEGLDNISVREEEGAKIVRDLTGKEAVVLIDPTMLLSKEKWLSISKEHYNKPKGKYLLTYFLGEMSKDSKERLKKIAKNKNLEIVNLADIKHKKYYGTGPSEFIDYIDNAEIFMTDSFHGCVFSLLLETPFIVCDREGHTKEENMGSRIETFVKKFKLESRKFNNIKEEDIFKCNYSESKKILDEERKKAWNYIKESFNIYDRD